MVHVDTKLCEGSLAKFYLGHRNIIVSVMIRLGMEILALNDAMEMT